MYLFIVQGGVGDGWFLLYQNSIWKFFESRDTTPAPFTLKLTSSCEDILYPRPGMSHYQIAAKTQHGGRENLAVL